MTLELAAADIQNLFNAIIAVILAIIALYNKQRTDIAKENAAFSIPVTAPVAAAPVTSISDGFILPRDGSKIMTGLDGWYARINPSPEAATIPDDKAYQAVSPAGKFYSGNRETVIYLITSPDAAGWRTRFA